MLKFGTPTTTTVEDARARTHTHTHTGAFDFDLNPGNDWHDPQQNVKAGVMPEILRALRIGGVGSLVGEYQHHMRTSVAGLATWLGDANYAKSVAAVRSAQLCTWLCASATWRT